LKQLWEGGDKEMRDWLIKEKELLKENEAERKKQVEYLQRSFIDFGKEKGNIKNIQNIIFHSFHFVYLFIDLGNHLVYCL